MKRARQDDAVTAEPQVVDSSRYESIISHFANTDKTTFNNNSNIVDNDLTTAYNGSGNGIESNLALLDLIHIFSNNVSIIRGVSTPDRPTDGSSSSGNDKTLEEKREHLNLLLKQISQFQPTQVEYATDTTTTAATTTSVTTPTSSSMSTPAIIQPGKRLAPLTRSADGKLRDRYSSYFPEYGEESPIDLKSVLSREFASYNFSAFQDPYAQYQMSDDVNDNDSNDNLPQGSDISFDNVQSEEGKGNDILSNDEQRLALPLVGLLPASNGGGLDPGKIQDGADTINIVLSPTFGVEDDSTGDITIFPQSEMSRLRSNISDLTGLDVDRLVEEVSAVVGKIDAPLRVEEQHTQILRHEGLPPKFKYTETTAQVVPSDDPLDPFIKVLSKKVEDGEIGGQFGELINSGNPASRKESMTSSMTASDDVRVNVTTKTNIVNIFTFNIIVSNSTGKNFSIDRVPPFKTNIETTATVDAGPNQNTISLYKYSAGHDSSTKNKSAGSPQSPELEKWLKILLKHQVSGKRGEGSLIQEAILKDASLLQLPMPSPSPSEQRPSYYRKVDEKDSDSNRSQVVETTEKNEIGPLGFTVAPTPTEATGTVNGLIKFVESMGVGAIPTIFAGAIATYPFWMPLLAGGRRRKRRETTTKVEIPENWLAYLLGTRFGQNAKMSKRSTTARATTTMSTFELPLAAAATTTSFVSTQADRIETARTLSKHFYPTTSTTMTTVSQPFEGATSFQISKLKIAGPPIPQPTTSSIPKLTTPSFMAKPILKTQSLMDRWAELLKKQTPKPVTMSLTEEATTFKPFSILDLNREADNSGITLPDDWKPSLQPFLNPLNSNSPDFEPFNLGENNEGIKTKPVVIGSDVSVSSSTVTEINFEPGKNAPIFVGVKSTDVPPNVWLTAEDIVTGLDQTGLDNGTESTASPFQEIKFEDGDDTKTKQVTLSGDKETQIDLVVLKKPQDSESSFDSIPIVIPGLPLPNKPTWRRRPTSPMVKKPPSQSKLFIQSFLKEYNKTGEAEVTKPTSRPQKLRPTKPSFLIELDEDKIDSYPRPVTLTTFSTDTNDVIPKWSNKPFIPKEVVVNSQTIKTHLTPEVVNTILRTQTTDHPINSRLKEEKTSLVSSSSTSLHFTTPTYDTSDGNNNDGDKVEDAPFYLGSNFPQDIDPSDVLKLAYGGSFTTFESDEERDREKAINRLIQQLEREYNNSLVRRSSAVDIETGGKSQLSHLSNFRQETTGKWVYLSGADKSQTATPMPAGLALTASSDEILDMIKTMEKEVLENNKTTVFDVKDFEGIKFETGNDEFQPEPEIVYLNDESLKLYLDEPTEKALAEKLVEDEQLLFTKMDDSILNTDHEHHEPPGYQDSTQELNFENEVVNPEKTSNDLDQSETTTTTTTTITTPITTTTTAVTTTELVDIINTDTEIENYTPPFPQGPLFLRADLSPTTQATSTTTATTDVTTTPTPTALEVLTNVLSQSAAPLAGLSAASLAYGAAAMLPLWLPLALGKKRKRRNISKTNVAVDDLLRRRIEKLKNKYDDRDFD